MPCFKIRDSAHNAIKRYMLQSQHIQDKSAEECEGYVTLLEEQWTRFKTAQQDVELTCGPETISTEEDTRGQVESWYITASSNLHRRLKEWSACTQSTNVVPLSDQPSKNHIPLPKIELPTFSGNPTEWVSFHDSFKSLVDANCNLSNAQKLQYLRTCLKGEALLVINNFSISNANYVEAWQMLKSRYEILRVIVDKHLQALFSIEKVNTDSASTIKVVLDSALQHTRALGALGRQVQFWDDILVHLVVSKLAFETRKQWELSLKSVELPTFEQLHNFLEMRCRSLEMVSASSDIAKPSSKIIFKRGRGSSATALHAQASEPLPQKQDSCRKYCSFCNNNHSIYNCTEFQRLDAEAKLVFVKQNRACLNCLSSGHYESKCHSASACRICRQRHHTALHDAFVSARFPSSKPPLVSTAIKSSQNPKTSLSSTSANATESNITATASTSSHHVLKSALTANSENLDCRQEKIMLLATAEVRIRDYAGCWQPARALFDNGSHASFISERCLQRLRLSKRSASVVVTGIGTSHGGRSKGETTITVAPRSADHTFDINVLILSKLTNDLPTIPVTSTWSHTQGLDLADPYFGRPGPIDILLGVDEMAQFLHTDFRKGPPDTPLAQRTVFGWVLFGTARNSPVHNAQVQSLYCTIQLEKAVNRFWELDESSHRKFLTAEEEYCEDYFTKTHKRAPDGRFIVKYPFKSAVPLGESKHAAVQSFLRMEKRFAADSKLREEYSAFMQELIDMGHMEAIGEVSTNSFYMPHHPVVKETSTTTKLRVVFNASMRSSSGYSLNDALMIGPQLQDDLFVILSRFRSHIYAMTADIAKMYRQVYVAEDCVDYQRIVWRKSPHEPLVDYRLLRVTYGVASASHLVVRSLQETGRQAAATHPLASQIVQRDFYMDDLLTGTSSKQTLKAMHKDITNILANGGFDLRKWATNCEELAQSLGDASHVSHYLADKDEVRTLGLMWHTQGDHLSFSVNLRELPAILSKRVFLSDSSSLFDPLGLIAPCTVKPKIWFQQIWCAGVDWDEAVPPLIAKQFLEHRQNLTKLNDLKVDRWLGTGRNGAKTEIHIFADASERAYAAVIYSRTIAPDSSIRIALVAARAKVAPLKTTTLPRLELCAAHLAAKLFRLVASSLDVSAYRVYAWSDSTVTLAWLQSHPSRWTTFVANRVADIQEVLPPAIWGHVRSECNPADCASRGMSPSELMQNPLWWQGPHWLKDLNNNWQHQPAAQQATDLELRSPLVHAAQSNAVWDLFTKYSTYSKLKRVTAYVLRFVYNMRHSMRKTGKLVCQELYEAELALIRYMQNRHFSNEVSLCRRNRPLPSRSNIVRLQPFLDEEDMLRVGGRIKHANVSVDVKHPIILPKNSQLAKLIVCDIHILTLHGGPQIMNATLQRRFWVISSRSLVRKVYRNCVKCTRLNHFQRQQTMADLPRSRVTQARCFFRSAVDLAGPYHYKMAPGRGSRSLKGYICSFICMTTGAMHLEFVSDLTSVAFLNAFKRFVNRRGYCAHMYSDNGTNFVGAEKQLHRMLEGCLADETVSEYFADSQIKWHFNPPRAPHMGGYWEAGIKRVKYHVKRCLGDVLLTFEEFSTLLAEIEACVNSRPLCAHASDVGDLEALTPGHFIVGAPLRLLPEPETREFKGNLGQRWQTLAAMRQHFWRRWRDEYLVNLQRRSKWLRQTPNLRKNDVVIIREDNIPPSKWKLAKVLECNPGSDGLVRVVRLKTSEGEHVRPICKLVRLPTSDDLPEPEFAQE